MTYSNNPYNNGTSVKRSYGFVRSDCSSPDSHMDGRSPKGKPQVHEDIKRALYPREFSSNPQSTTFETLFTITIQKPLHKSSIPPTASKCASFSSPSAFSLPSSQPRRLLWTNVPPRWHPLISSRRDSACMLATAMMDHLVVG